MIRIYYFSIAVVCISCASGSATQTNTFQQTFSTNDRSVVSNSLANGSIQQDTTHSSQEIPSDTSDVAQADSIYKIGRASCRERV